MFHLSKKILIGISLVIAYLLTLQLSLFLTPPYPRLEIIADSINRFRSGQYKINLPAIFTFPQIARVNKLQENPPTPLLPPKAGSAGQAIRNPPSNVPGQQITDTPYPTSSFPTPTPINSVNKYPTFTPQPSSTPKPTKPPKPTPTPPFKLTNPRPGKNIRDVASIVGKLFCTPPAMVYAIYDNEGDNFRVESNWTYKNTYQGSDPTDISGSTTVFGVTQMMGDTWHRIKPYVAQKLGTSEISLNVTFDSMAAAAYHVRNVSLAMQDHVACADWPVDYILYGACRYNGACKANTFGQKQYYNSYTYSVCASYNEYGGVQKKCQ